MKFIVVLVFYALRAIMYSFFTLSYQFFFPDNASFLSLHHHNPPYCQFITPPTHSLLTHLITIQDQQHRQSASVIHTNVGGSVGSKSSCHQAGGGGVGEKTHTRSSMGRSLSRGGASPGSLEGMRRGSQELVIVPIPRKQRKGSIGDVDGDGEGEGHSLALSSIPGGSRPGDSEREREGEGSEVDGRSVEHVVERKGERRSDDDGGGGGGGGTRRGDEVTRRNVVPADVTTVNEKTTTLSANHDPIWDILVVDDSPLNRKMLMKTLRAAGHVVEVRYSIIVVILLSIDTVTPSITHIIDP